MADILAVLLVMFICLVCAGFFSGSEIGVVSADRAKLRHEAAKGSRGAQLALSMLKKPEWLLSTTLVGTNIAIVTNTTSNRRQVAVRPSIWRWRRPTRGCPYTQSG